MREAISLGNLLGHHKECNLEVPVRTRAHQDILKIRFREPI